MLKLGAFGPPHGQEPTAEAIRSRALEQAQRAGWPRLDRADLVFGKYGVIEHRPTGDFFVLHRGELSDAVYSGAVAYYVEDGTVRFLEPPAGGPRNRDELEQLRAKRERRNAPRPRRQAAPR